MLELSCDNLIDYLRQHGWLPTGPARAEVLAGGVSNQVLRVTGPQGRFVVKQSRPRLRTRDAWFSDLNRIWREQEVMLALAPLLPAGTVPGILFVDRENFVYGMTHAPFEARVWKEVLLSAEPFAGWGSGFGRFAATADKAKPGPPTPAQNLAHRIGMVLGMIHEKTAQHPEAMEPFRDHTVYVQLRVDPFYRCIQERRPEVAHVVGEIVAEMLSRKEALCHGDYTPKNILVDAAGFTLVDYETAHFGDPTMDLGLFLAHLLLKACRSIEHRPAFFDLTRSFWQGYREQVGFAAPAELQARGIRHLGVCLLARIDGTSPVDYLSEPQREAMRRWGRRILLDKLTTWDDVLSCGVAEMPVS